MFGSELCSETVSNPITDFREVTWVFEWPFEHRRDVGYACNDDLPVMRPDFAGVRIARESVRKQSARGSVVRFEASDEPHTLGAEGVLPGRQIESFLRVFK